MIQMTYEVMGVVPSKVGLQVRRGISVLFNRFRINLQPISNQLPSY